MTIPERLNPPPDDWMECPDCKGSGHDKNSVALRTPDYIPPLIIKDCIFRADKCPRCDGDGVVSKAELKRELEAVIGDIKHDRRGDDKWRREEESNDDKRHHN